MNDNRAVEVQLHLFYILAATNRKFEIFNSIKYCFHTLQISNIETLQHFENFSDNYIITKIYTNASIQINGNVYTMRKIPAV